MNQEAIKRTAEAVGYMEECLKTKLQGKQVWEKTHVKRQIDARQQGKDVFSLDEHIRGMVYAMLSAEMSWKRMEKEIDETTGRLSIIDRLFCNYDIETLRSCSAETLSDEIGKLGLSGRRTKYQVSGLISDNIRKLKQWEDAYGSVDGFYRQFIEQDPSYHVLVKMLSQDGSEHKMKEIGEALTAEYLRNVGYDMAKPDRHLRRILGSGILGCSKEEIAPIFESMDIVRGIANHLGRGVAEVDYILWSYCATGYGDICTKERPLCHECVVRAYCKKEDR